MKESRPIVSIVIPTKDRSQYAINTIETLLKINENIEIIVSDTSNNKTLNIYFKDLADKRLIIHYLPSTLDIVSNFNTALSKVKGEYVVFLGDDDFVTKEIVTVAKWAKKFDIDAIKFNFCASYNWPDFKHKKNMNKDAGRLALESFTGQVLEVDVAEFLHEAKNNPGRGPMNMPRAYLGMVSRVILNKISANHQKVFGGVSPDIYSAVLISHEASKVYEIDYPVIVPGAGGNSGTGKSANGKHIGSLMGNAYMAAFKGLVWDNRIPAFYSVETVWGFSLLKALEKIGDYSLPFERLYVKCLYLHPTYWRFTLEAIKVQSRVKGKFKFTIKFLKALFLELNWLSKMITIKVYRKFRPNESKKNQVTFDNLTSVKEASYELSLYLKSYKLNLVEPDNN